MNTAKSGNYSRIIAFFLVAATLFCTFGFAAEGWQLNQNESDSGKVDNSSDESDDNKDDGTVPPPEVYIPEYVNYITGLETTEELARGRTTCFIMDASSPLYGISGADLVVEVPTESGATRLMVFTSNSKPLGKIGSLCKTRGYISNIARYFGAVLVSTGCDDTVEYDSIEPGASHFDLSQNTGYHYTEYTHFTYTNGALINAGLTNANIGTQTGKLPALPYTFNDFGKDSIAGTVSGRSIVYPYSDNSETALYYSDTDGQYIMSRNGTVKADMLTDSSVTFENVFLLFADSVTYETAESSELILNTQGKGTGYYFTEGTAIPIRWEAGDGGNLLFYSDSGEVLKINRGNSYIGFMKSSMKDSVSFS